jgi:hypothetical protein
MNFKDGLWGELRWMCIGAKAAWYKCIGEQEQMTGSVAVLSLISA